MRGLRSTIALLVVLIGLGAYIYFVTWKTAGSGDTGDEDRKRSSPRSKPTRSRRSKVKSESGDVDDAQEGRGGVAGRRADRRPRPTSPKCRASPARSGSLEIVRVIDENPADLKDYGLDAPRIEIDFKAAGDKASGRLLIGDKTPTGADLYAKRNDEKRVFLIPAYQEATLNKSTFDLRDKTVLKIEREKVDGVDVDGRRQDRCSSRRTAREWKITKPLRGAGRFRGGRGAGRPRADGADEVDRRRRARRPPT